jgi:hypothetical protein
MTPACRSSAPLRSGRPPVLGHLGQGGYLPGWREHPGGDRAGELPAGLAAVAARALGPGCCAAPGRAPARAGAPSTHVAAGAGHGGGARRLGLAPPVVVADAGYGESGELRLGWRSAGSPLWCRSRPPPAPPRRRSAPRSPPIGGGGVVPAPRPCQAVLAGPAGGGGRPGRGQDRRLARGTRGRLRSWFVVLGVRPAGVKLGRAAAGGSCRCAGCWPSGPPASPSRSSTGSRTCPAPPYGCTHQPIQPNRALLMWNGPSREVFRLVDGMVWGMRADRAVGRLAGCGWDG